MDIFIELPTDKGVWVTVPAVWVGGFAVHVAIENVKPAAYTVTHINTRYRLAAFSAEHVAINFAKRLNEIEDFDGLAERMIDGTTTETDKLVMEEITRTRKHKSYVILPTPLGAKLP